MKKNIFKLCLGMAVSATMLTGCIEEILPESSLATSDQIGSSATALEAALNGLPSQMVQGYFVYEGKQVHETDIAYPSLMLAQTELLGDVMPLEWGYDWWNSYNRCLGMADNTYPSYLTYFTLYKFVKAANDVIAVVNVEDESLSSEMRGFAGIAHANRAFNYYMMMVLFEPVENIYTDCSKVLGLTVPIVTEQTVGDAAKNNPRATREQMMEFIISDLDKAEKALTDYTHPSKTFPGLAVVYGLKAKTYLWNEEYDKAAEYARKAIDESDATPMTKAQWLDPTTGFNTAVSSWMWYFHPTAANMGNLANFIGHISNESDWGYAALSKLQMSKLLYDQIAKTDFRKQAFLDPDRENNQYQSVRGAAWLAEQPDYMSLKFRCVNGNFETYSVGAAADIPVMRVEEMYFIEAEAVGASQGVAAGINLLNSFMQHYRQPDYNCKANDLRSFQLEVLKQMRIEFWGEGNAFPVAKRLKPDVIQNYEGTNAPTDQYKINCKGIKPNWNMVIPNDEVNANSALLGLNNPDPSGAISTRPTPIGEFAPGNN